ncbi:MAG: hypothetical protein V4669_08640 [Pseudomonadota bacterium]
MQLNIRIGTGAIFMAAILACGLWYAHDRGWLARGAGSATSTGNGKDPEFIPTNGGVLVLAWVKGYETFQRRSPSEIDVGGITFPLPFGDTVSEISTAAKYQYQIRLEKKWPMKCSEQMCVVRTGPVELAQPVAIYHEQTTRKTASGWARFDKAQNLEALNHALGAALQVRGNAPRNRDVGMRDGRAEIEKFVRQWMASEQHGDRRIVVLYPGEELVDGKPVGVQ